VQTSYIKAIEILGSVRKTIRNWPRGVRREFGAVLLRLQRGEFIGMPDMKAMPSIRKGTFEIRIKSGDGTFRAFLISFKETGVLVFHAFVKKSQSTPLHEIETGKMRLSNYLREKS
jgi:phage-related protein